MIPENENATVQAADAAPTQSLFANRPVATVGLTDVSGTAEPTEVEPEAPVIEEPHSEPAAIPQEPQEELPEIMDQPEAEAEPTPEPIPAGVSEPVKPEPADETAEPVEPEAEAVEPEPVSEQADDAEVSLEEVQNIHAAEDAAIAAEDSVDKPKSVKELQAEKQKLEEELQARQNEEKKAVIAQIAAVVKTYNIPVAELAAALGGVPNPRKGTKAPILYRDGANEWSGRGKLPNWLKGKNPEDYRVA